MSPTERHRIEQRLKRASDFFGQVILRFVMRDVGMLIDKCELSLPLTRLFAQLTLSRIVIDIKRSGAWVGE